MASASVELLCYCLCQVDSALECPEYLKQVDSRFIHFYIDIRPHVERIHSIFGLPFVCLFCPASRPSGGNLRKVNLVEGLGCLTHGPAPEHMSS